MTDEIYELLLGVLARMERNIVDRQCPALVGLQGSRTLWLSDYDYLRDEETAAAFERRAAQMARDNATMRWILAVPQIWRLLADRAQYRAVSNLPLHEGEEEVIAWTSYDHGDGVDYGVVPYTRRPSGEPVFDEPQIFIIPITQANELPGSVLLRTLLADDAP